MFSIKEVALECGKTPQAIRDKAKQLCLTLQRDDKGHFAITDEQKVFIIGAFSNSEKAESKDTLQDSAKLVQSTLHALEAQLIAKDEQLAAQIRQISTLQEQNTQLTAALEHTTASLQAAQALHAGTIKQQLGTGVDSKQSEPEEQPKKKKHWWQR